MNVGESLVNIPKVINICIPLESKDYATSYHLLYLFSSYGIPQPITRRDRIKYVEGYSKLGGPLSKFIEQIKIE
jgi:adenine-specific DNA methylase